MIRTLAAALATTTCIVALATPAAAQTREYNIPAGSLKNALDAYVRQSGKQVVYRADQVRSARSPGVRGSHSPEAALAALLAGSGFTTRSDGNLVAIVQGGNAPAVAEAATETSGEGDDSDNVIVVTGTNIKGGAPVGSPVISLDRVDIERSGAATVDQFLRTIPQNFGNIDPSSSNTLRFSPVGAEVAQNTTLGSSPNVHGLGLGATLTLINGRRLSPGGDSGSVVDVSVIPLAAIERVDVLTDGASAIYGADAVAGVVNFVTRKDYDGLQSSVRYGDTTEGGAAELDLNQLAGTAWSNGSAFAAYSFSKRYPLYARERDFINTSAGGARPDFSLFPAQRTHSGFASLRQSVGDAFDLDLSGNIADRRTEYTDAFGTDIETNLISQLDWGAGGRLTYRLSPDWQIDLDGQYYRADLKFDTERTSGNFLLDSTTELMSGDLRLQGSLFELPGGDAKALLGGGVRKEDYDYALNYTSFDFELLRTKQRTVLSAYGEMILPIIAGNGSEGLSISLAGRYDDYGKAGDTFNPKFGVSWQINPTIRLRGSYGTSFRPPSLYQSIASPELALVFDVFDPSTGDTIPGLVRFAQTNENLRPETSTSYSAGIDISPASVPKLNLSLTYFDIAYTDQIGTPPLAGGLSDFLGRPELADLIIFNPSAADVQALIDTASASASYFDFTAGGPVTAGDIEAIFNGGIQNLASTHARGLDATADYRFGLLGGNGGISTSASYLIDLKRRTTPTGIVFDAAGTAYSAPDFRLRGSSSWENGGFSSVFTVNYTSPFDNPYVTPAADVRAYTTVDLQLAYSFSFSNSNDSSIRVALNASNIFDARPPRVLTSPTSVDLGFDPANASARGRFISLQATADW